MILTIQPPSYGSVFKVSGVSRMSSLTAVTSILKRQQRSGSLTCPPYLSPRWSHPSRRIDLELLLDLIQRHLQYTESPIAERILADWPAGAYYETGGEMEASDTANEALFSLVPIVIGIMVLLLVMRGL